MRDDAVSSPWPTIRLDAVRRLSALGAGLRVPFFAETVFARPFDVVWSSAADLERLPELIPAMREFRIVDSDGERIRARAVSRIGHRADFDVVLRPGWCLMQSRVVVAGMAAVDAGPATRFAIIGGFRSPLARPLFPVLAPIGRARGRRMLDQLGRRFDEG
jgi:hypothetical protein